MKDSSFNLNKEVQLFIKEKIEEFIQKNPDSTIEYIANTLGIATQTLRAHIKNLGISYQLKRVGVKSEKTDEIKKYIKQNPEKSLDDYAKEFNTTRSYIQCFIKRYGIKYISKRPGRNKIINEV